MLSHARQTVLGVFVVASVGCGGPTSEDVGAPTWEVVGPTVTIGEADGDEGYLFETVAAVAQLPDGRIAVADRGYAEIRIYSPDGRLEAEFGREGEGPGEFSYITEMFVRPPDTLEVYDSGLFRRTSFLPDGTITGSTTYAVSDGRPELYLGRFSGGGAAFSWIDQTAVGTLDREVQPDPMRFGRFGDSGQLEAEIGEGTGLRRSPNGVVPFTPQLHSFLYSDTVFHTDGLRPTINAIAPTGDSAPPIELPVMPVTPDGAEAALRATLQARGDEQSLQRLDRAPEDSIPAVSEVVMDHDGRFWVKQYDPATDAHLAGAWAGVQGGEWWVVPRDGETLGRVSMPPTFRPLWIRGDVMLGVAQDGFGVQRIQRFEIRR